MFEIETELKDISKRKINGVINSANKLEGETNLLKLYKEIEKTRNLRTKIISSFEKDILEIIKSMNYSYLKNVPYPVIIDYKKLFIDDLLSLKVFTKDGVYDNFLFSDTEVQNNNFSEVERIYTEIQPFIKRILDISKESNLLNNSFYDKLEVLLYNEYLHKLIISGDGIRLPINDFYNLNGYDKNNLLRFYYDNLKKILKNIQVQEVLELEKYKSDITKQKVLSLYRG